MNASEIVGGSGAHPGVYLTSLLLSSIPVTSTCENPDEQDGLAPICDQGICVKINYTARHSGSQIFEPCFFGIFFGTFLFVILSSFNLSVSQKWLILENSCKPKGFRSNGCPSNLHSSLQRRLQAIMHPLCLQSSLWHLVRLWRRFMQYCDFQDNVLKFLLSLNSVIIHSFSL